MVNNLYFVKNIVEIKSDTESKPKLDNINIFFILLELN